MLRIRCLRFLMWAGLSLLGLGWGATTAQAQLRHLPLDSLRRSLQHAPDTERVMTLYRMSGCFPRRRIPFDSGTYYINEAYRLAYRLNWTYGRALTATAQGRLLFIRPDYARAQAKFYEALELWAQLKQPSWYQFISEFNLGMLYTELQDHAQARRWLLTALQTGEAVQRQSPYRVETYYVYDALGVDAARRKNYPEAISYFQRALRTVERQSARPQSLDVSVINGGPISATTTICNNLADAYLGAGQVQAAVPYLARARRLAQQASPFAHALVLGTSAQVYLQLRQPRKALGYALYSLELMKQTGQTEPQAQISAVLEQVYCALGDYAEAHRYAKLTQALERKVLTEKQVLALAEQATRYQTQQKERDIHILRQRNEIQRLAALQQRTLRNAAFAGMGLLLVAGAVLYTRYRQRQRMVRLLDQQNQEKAWLLREVHHRVKNNLQIVLSLLDSQRRALREPVAVEALQESQNRIRSMALIHQHLYQTTALARVEMRQYLHELVASLQEALTPISTDVALATEVADVSLSAHTVVPLGLIVNELVTNAFKSAFPPDWPRKELRVSLTAQPAGTYQLRVADTGVGLPELDLARVSSLGLRLVAGLVEQLGGQLTISRMHGTCFTITFQEVVSENA